MGPRRWNKKLQLSKKKKRAREYLLPNKQTSFEQENSLLTGTGWGWSMKASHVPCPSPFLLPQFLPLLLWRCSTLWLGPAKEELSCPDPGPSQDTALTCGEGPRRSRRVEFQAGKFLRNLSNHTIKSAANFQKYNLPPLPTSNILGGFKKKNLNCVFFLSCLQMIATYCLCEYMKTMLCETFYKMAKL